MTAAEFWSNLRSLDVKFSAENGGLCCNGSQGALTAELRAALSSTMPELLHSWAGPAPGARSRRCGAVAAIREEQLGY